MSEKNNSAQEGRPAAPEDESCDTDSMIWNAKSLQRVVKELERNGSESPQLDLLHIQGRGLGVIVKSGVWKIDSSGGLIDVCHFDSIVEFHSSNHLGQIIEPS